MKKFFTISLFLIVCISLYAKVITGKCGDNLTWTFNTQDSTLTINGSGAMKNYSSYGSIWDRYQNEIAHVLLPNGLTTIGDYAFYKCNAIDSIEIPNSVESIGNYAFYECSKLTSIELGEKIYTIGPNAFAYCSSLVSIILPESVTTIGNSAFNRCSALTTITIPSNVSCIEDHTFSACLSLSSVNISSSVTNIGSGAFSNCLSLTSIIIPHSVVSIGSKVFDYCKSLESIIVEPNNSVYDSRNNCDAIIETASNNLLFGCKNTIIPDGIKTIEKEAFYSCTGLISIVIPNSVISIGESAFQSCSNLTSITIGNGVSNFGNNAFWECSSLAVTYYNGTIAQWCNIDFYGGYYSNPIYLSKNLYVNNQLLTELIIPDTVAEIKSYTFFDCHSVTSITIPSNVMIIGDNALNYTGFYNNEANWESGALYINDWLIATKESLVASYTIKQNTRKIADYAFRSCDNLKNLTIPSTITNVGKGIFNYCYPINTVICKATSVPTTRGYFFGHYDYYSPKVTLYVPAESLEMYKSADDWKDFSLILPIEGSSTNITDTHILSNQEKNITKIMSCDGRILILKDDSVFNLLGLKLK